MNRHKRKEWMKSLGQGVQRRNPVETANVFLDGIPIGSFSTMEYDMPHHYGKFDALPAYNSEAGILHRLEVLWKLCDDDSLADAESDSIHQEWETVQEEVDRRVVIKIGDSEPKEFGYFMIVDGKYSFRGY